MGLNVSNRLGASLVEELAANGYVKRLLYYKPVISRIALVRRCLTCGLPQVRHLRTSGELNIKTMSVDEYFDDDRSSARGLCKSMRFESVMVLV